jgi:hypothetical protein
MGRDIISGGIADFRFQIADFTPLAVRREATKIETSLCPILQSLGIGCASHENLQSAI